MYQSQDSGLFLTAYTSTWLKKDTGITAPYVDTRLNETFILMLKDFQKSVLWLNDLEPMRDYADFFYSKYVSRDQVYTIQDGVFFPDYFKKKSQLLAHTSLNHQLGIAQIMLNAWQKYEDDNHLKVFNAVMLFVKLSCEEWKKPSGDLFYGIKKCKGGALEYFGDDYIYVTLIDLMRVQIACCDNGFGRLSYLDNLIESKLSYLKTTEYNVFSEYPKKASGEKVNSVEEVLVLYKQLYSPK